MSALRKIDWSERFSRPIKVKGRRAALKTRAEAGLFILEELPAHRQHRRPWQAAAAALQNGAPIARVQHLLVRALGSDGALA